MKCFGKTAAVLKAVKIPAWRHISLATRKSSLPEGLLKETPAVGYAESIEEETQVSRATQGEQDNYEMQVRAANIVRAGESLMKLVSDLKQFLILNVFPSVNEAINQRNQQLRSLQEECDKKLIALRDEISINLYELEEEYYSSRYK
ncbi:mediator of RNA polymerase II transcription subunit 22-like isoform X1 [Zootoca vivipara]|uniref:mediator of RNA polymerase II transcription subunit 22-like isoform X1 n=1 Tax=Zootoca vivipara TaxID=8524 RepID=UPI00293BF396|nr:mediator of RNA polymerase II transcription subunit 22-like isoform X1 [Zootoca vivipara]